MLERTPPWLPVLVCALLGGAAALAQEADEPPQEPHEAVEPANPIDVLRQGLTELRPAFQRCAGRDDPLTEEFGECVCDAICAHRFAWPPPDSGETVTLRLPFIDIDGLAATIEPGGRVSQCSYHVGMEDVAVDVVCGERDDLEANTSR